MASHITGISIVYSTVCSGKDQRKHQSSASLAFVRGIHRWPVISRTKGHWHGKCFHLMTSSCELFPLAENHALQWRHHERDGVSNQSTASWLILNRLFRHRSKKNQSSVSLTFVGGIHRWHLMTSSCENIKPPHYWPFVTWDHRWQMASNVEIVSVPWHHRGLSNTHKLVHLASNLTLENGDR